MRRVRCSDLRGVHIADELNRAPPRSHFSRETSLSGALTSSICPLPQYFLALLFLSSSSCTSHHITAPIPHMVYTHPYNQSRKTSYRKAETETPRFSETL